MSRWLGTQAPELRLSDAATALQAAVWQAAVPGWIWIAGIFFPSLSMLVGVTTTQFVELETERGWSISWQPWLLAILAGPMMLFPLRLQAGLALTMRPSALAELPARARRTPRLRECWNSSRGLLLPSLSLWLRLTLVLLVGLAVVVVPPYFFLKGTGMDPHSVAFYLLLAPFFALAGLYQFTIALLYQLALQSLVQHRRGASSALTHAWRIAANHPWAILRAGVVDFMLTVTVVILSYALSAGLALTIVGILLIPVLLFVMSGAEGLARAGYWARIYLALGGMPGETLPREQLSPPELQSSADPATATKVLPQTGS
jgi:hypothetical protein